MRRSYIVRKVRKLLAERQKHFEDNSHVKKYKKNNRKTCAKPKAKAC
jgi:hypothetical protein